MNTLVLTRTYPEPAFCEKEILRYAGCREADDGVLSLLRACIDEARGRLTYTVCYRELPVAITGSHCDFSAFAVDSGHLAKTLAGCERVILFAATVGVGIDRLIARYGRVSPAKAVMLQAIGAERIEALCDAFCADIAKEMQTGLRPRFSPGYGDLPLTLQQDIVSVLDCGKRIGLCLNDSLLLSPSKSVTAIVGLTDGETPKPPHPCGACNQTDCAFRGAV